MRSATLQIAPSGPTSAPSEPTREALIDEFGELDRKYRLWKPDLDRYEALKAIIKPWFDNEPAQLPAKAEGFLYTLRATPRELEASPNKPAIWKQLKKDRFIQICTITQAAIKAAPELGEAWIDKLFVKHRTGSRKLSVVLKEPAEAA